MGHAVPPIRHATCQAVAALQQAGLRSGTAGLATSAGTAAFSQRARRVTVVRCRKAGGVPEEARPRLQQPALQQHGPPLPPPGQGSTPKVLEGNALLLAVAVLWGSYTPTLRYVYTLPGPPAPVVLTAARAVLQVLLLAGTAAVVGLGSDARLPGGRNEEQGPREPLLQGTERSSGRGSGCDAGDFDAEVAALPTSPPLLERLMPWAPVALVGGLELGVWNAAGTIMQTLGLSMVSATRGAILVQATAVFTPALSALFGQPPGRWVLAGSALALAGTVLVGLDGLAGGSGAADPAEWPPLAGEAATLAAALSYSMATVRMPVYARRAPPLALALGKSAALAGVAVTLLVARGATLTAEGRLPAELWPNYGDSSAWAAIAWSAVGPGAVGAYLHVKGQSMVSATDAQVVFSTVPLWSALIAIGVLHESGFGALTWAGGAVLIAATLVASLGPED